MVSALKNLSVSILKLSKKYQKFEMIVLSVSNEGEKIEKTFVKFLVPAIEKPLLSLRFLRSGPKNWKTLCFPYDF